MTDKFDEVKEKLLSTDYPQWRNVLSCGVLMVISTGAVSSEIVNRVVQLAGFRQRIY